MAEDYRHKYQKIEQDYALLQHTSEYELEKAAKGDNTAHDKLLFQIEILQEENIQTKLHAKEHVAQLEHLVCDLDR
jgi:hypothetical protein